jgi:two-component system nitrogen regulation sensor histidine kinase NtrY
VRKTENVTDICHDALLFQKQAYPDIAFTFDSVAPELPASCDRSQLTQVLNNLLINAIDSVHERLQQSPVPAGQIDMQVETRGENVVITVCDNGTGLPEKVRDQLLEPYVTTKKKGSGLGLAIVKKIMEDHDGSIEIGDFIDGGIKSGAKAVIVFPRDVSAGDV